MKISRRSLMKGLTASAAAHSFGTLSSFAAPIPLESRDPVVFLFGLPQDDLFLQGVHAAFHQAGNASVTTVRSEGSMLSSLEKLRDQLAEFKGRRAIAYLNHGQHAVFQELLREAKAKLLQVGRHSWAQGPVQHSTHRIMAANDPRYAENLASFMAETSWNFILNVSTLSPREAKGSSGARSVESGLVQGSTRYPRFSTEGQTHELSFANPSGLPSTHLAPLLGYVLAQNILPSSPTNFADTSSWKALRSTIALRPDSAVTLSMEL